MAKPPDKYKPRLDSPQDGGPKMQEVLKRREEIVKFSAIAYEGYCYDFEKAAKEAGFENRKEADAFLSKLTGSKYGPHLKTGDRLVNPKGQDIIYYATAKDLYEAIRSMKGKSMEMDFMITEARAHMMAEERKIPLDVGTPMRQRVFRDIIENRVLDMKNGDKLELRLAHYKRIDGKTYYNTSPNQNELWGTLTDGETPFIRNAGKFYKCREHGGYVDPNDKYHSTVYVYEEKEPTIFFDVKGNRLN